MAQIEIRSLHKAFGRFTAVRDSTFTIRDGEFFMLLGPSGCGKTTTLRMIAGLELPTSGTILIGGEDVSQQPARARDIAFVFQMFALYPHMTVRGNIAYPLVSQGLPRAEVRTRVAEAARILGIAEILDRPVGGLSGGDRQRVALGRAIVRRPAAFLMDEPLGALDAEFREHMAEELRALHDRIGGTTVYVTHDQLEAMQMGDRIAVMNGGVVEQIGTPQEVYDRPATLFVASFIGQPAMNLLPFQGAVAPGDAQVRLGAGPVSIPPLDEGPSGDALVLGVRPEHVRLGEGDYPARVEAVEYLGTSQVVTLVAPHGSLRARIGSGQRVREGEALTVGFPASQLSLFDGGTGRALRLRREALHG